MSNVYKYLHELEKQLNDAKNLDIDKVVEDELEKLKSRVKEQVTQRKDNTIAILEIRIDTLQHVLDADCDSVEKETE